MDHIQIYSEYASWQVRVEFELLYSESLYKWRWDFPHNEVLAACRKAVYEPRRLKRLEEWL